MFYNNDDERKCKICKKYNNLNNYIYIYIYKIELDYKYKRITV